MNDFATMNAIYETSFGSHKPARSAVEVARLPKDVLVEIECIARWVLISRFCALSGGNVPNFGTLGKR